MRIALSALLIGATALAGASYVTAVAGEHVMLTPDEISWKPAPPSLEPGAEMAVLYGDPSQAELFAVRLRLPANYHVAPHMHPNPEVVTVLSGTFLIGMGETADRDRATRLPAGSIVTIPAGTPHFVFTDGETIVQQNSVGPFGITYVNPEDDPRNGS